MPEKTVAQKARVKPGATIAVVNRVKGIVEALGLPKGVTFVKPADAQLVFLFVRTRAELKARMPRAVAALAVLSKHVVHRWVATRVIGGRPPRLP